MKKGVTKTVGKGKRVIFASAAMLLSTLLTFGMILGVDVYLHVRYAKVAGLNVWGYRGPIVKRKKPGEQRIVVLGGSTALGYGVTPEKSFPAYLERKLADQRRRTGRGPVSVVNLAYNNEGAYSFKFTLRDYEYLGYDIALLYTGYNDLGLNTRVFRHESPVFKLTGYLPIFPIIFQEKAMALRYGGQLEDAYWSRKTKFVPNRTDRIAAATLETAVRISKSLERQLGRLTDADKIEAQTAGARCEEQWTYYCRAVYSAVDYALARGKRVIVVTEPYIADRQVEQQRVMVVMLRERFGDHPGLRYVNLGRTVDLRDPTLAWDGMHLTPLGNERIAAGLVPQLLDIIE